MVYEVSFIIGRIIVGLFFFMNGANHLREQDMMIAYAKSKHIPFPKFSVIVSGILLILVGLSFILNYYLIYSLIAVSVFLFLTAVFMHNFWALKQSEKMGEMINFMKDFALLGYSLIVLAFLL